jgi:hypothetical protein
LGKQNQSREKGSNELFLENVIFHRPDDGQHPLTQGLEPVKEANPNALEQRRTIFQSW